MRVQQGAPAVHVCGAVKIAQNVEPHCESLNMNAGEGSYIASDSALKSGAGSESNSPMHSVAVAASPPLASARTCGALLQSQRVNRHSSPLPLDDARTGLWAVDARLEDGAFVGREDARGVDGPTTDDGRVVAGGHRGAS